MNHAARIVLIVVSLVVVAYTAADVYISVVSGKLDPSSRQMFAGAVGALIAIIASTKANPTEPTTDNPTPVIVQNTPAEPVPTTDQETA